MFNTIAYKTHYDMFADRIKKGELAAEVVDLAKRIGVREGYEALLDLMVYQCQIPKKRRVKIPLSFFRSAGGVVDESAESHVRP